MYKPMMECLESRDLLTTVVLLDGTLFITGTRGDDVIEVTRADVITVENHVFPADAVRQVVIDGAGGNDQITITIPDGGSRFRSCPVAQSGDPDDDGISGSAWFSYRHTNVETGLQVSVDAFVNREGTSDADFVVYQNDRTETVERLRLRRGHRRLVTREVVVPASLDLIVTDPAILPEPDECVEDC